MPNKYYLSPVPNQTVRPLSTEPGPIEYEIAEQPKETFNCEPFDLNSFVNYQIEVVRRDFPEPEQQEVLKRSIIDLSEDEIEQLAANLAALGHENLRSATGPTGLDEGFMFAVRSYSADSVYDAAAQIASYVRNGSRVYLLSLSKHPDYTKIVDPVTFLPIVGATADLIGYKYKLRLAEQKLS